ncbi:MAG TPA: hypothetical protein VL400_14020 [Polyangiaceae bacterium]|jgi:hypothetical protein|nr:hypothetical protein [Polyangiaceae bacterium]
MMTHGRALVAAIVLSACGDAATKDTASSSSAAAKPSSSAATSASAATPATASATAGSTGAVPAPSAAASAAADADCPAGARKNEEARYCITLPEKKLAVSYEGDAPAQGIREELEIGGNRVVITVGAAPKMTVAQLRDDTLKRIGANRVDGGDLPNGFWNDSKDGTGHIVEAVVVSKYIITCTHWVREEKDLDGARALCKSLKTF